MLKIDVIPYELNFKIPAGTSRGVLNNKLSYIIRLEENGVVGYGEAGPLPKLSVDFGIDFKSLVEEKIKKGITLEELKTMTFFLSSMPSLKFAFESAILDLESGGTQALFDTPFVNRNEGIRINGLIWMGDVDFMLSQIKSKLDSGFSCLKMKIGAIDFELELSILKKIRSQFNEQDLELRVDANGAFSIDQAGSKLERLSKFNLHSIEQPIKQGQVESMALLCNSSPVPIALDEELIGVVNKQALIEDIKPQYIILKPTLVGGFQSCNEWIQVANSQKISWWITSALESNIGLNAIAQYTSQFDLKMPQGLGTGSLFTNNIKSPLQIEGESLFYLRDSQDWGLDRLP